MAKKAQDLSPEELLEQALIPESEQPYEVPGNWVWCLWKSCGNFVAGNGFNPVYQGYKEFDIPFYKVGSLKYSEQDGYLFNVENTINEEMRKTLKASLVPPNSLIFAKIGEAIRLNRRCLNRVACCIDNNLMAFLPSRVCNFKFSYYWSCNQEFYDLANATTVPAIRKSDLEAIAFPLPPLAEQQRIVDRIESLFEKLDQAKGLIQDALDSFENRKAAIFHKAFTGELTEKWREEKGLKFDNEWEKTNFSNIATVKSNLVSIDKYLDFPHIAPDNIEKRTGKLLAYNTIGEDGVKSAKHRFYAGQILYSKIRPYLSKVVVVDFDGLCSADMYPIETTLETKFLFYYMLSDEFVMYASSAGSRSVLPKINQKELAILPVKYPSNEEQKEIVRILDDLLEKETQARDLVDLEEQIEHIKKSILAKAFRGELNTNNPDEESALELLKEVLASPAAFGKKIIL